MYRQQEEQPPWGQGQAQGQQQPQGQQQWQQSPMHGGQQTPQYYQQSPAAQQYMPGNLQGSEQAWSQSGQLAEAPFQQRASMYGPGPPGSQSDGAWQSAPQQQQGSQGWQGGPQGQYMGPGGPQQQPAALPDNRRSWVGAVTQLIPPNYGIVDRNAFYVEPVVVGQIPGVGDRVACEAVPNTDGGMYEWRVLRVEMVQPTALTLMPPNQAQQARPFAVPHNRPVAGRARESPLRASPTRSPAYNASPAHQPSAVPSKPLPGLNKETLKQEAPVAAAEPVKYNQMAPPMTAYTAEYALAKASAAMDGNRQQAIPPPQPDRRPFFSGQAQVLDEEAQKRSAAAAQQLGSAIGDPASIGAKLMSKMGFGVAGQGLGRTGQGIVAPVEAIKMGQGQGLGFAAAKQRNRSPDRDRPARRRGPREDRPRARTPPRRRPRSRSASPRSRSRSPGAEFRGRYRVEPPKFPPLDRERGVAALSKRYRNLYIPADFCHASATWVDSLPEWDPLPLTHHVSMKIAKAEKHAGDGASEAAEDSKDASVEEHAALAAATDALTPGKRWGARVVIMSGVNARLLHNSSVKVFQHPLKKLQFLTGRKGRSELTLIGGAWDPVDGANPAHSPSTLIATASRAFKAATGVDLSTAVHWTNFAHVRYLRKNDLEDDIEENVVVYLVDAHELAVPDQDAKDVLAKAASAATTEIEAKKALDAAEEEEKSAEANFQLLGSQDVPPPPEMGDNLTITPSEMTVAALQEALSKRGLDTKWNPLKSKKELVDRLQDFVDTKRKEHAALDKDYKAYEDARKALEAAKAKATEAKEAVKTARAAVLEALKTVSDPPATEMVQIQPNKDFLGSKESFHAEVSSLDTLLGYTEKDDREGMFEVSVFAELFREMLEARFGQGILRTLEVLEKEDRKARAKKAEERRAKKEAEAAAKAKAKESAEGSAKASADKEVAAGATAADGSSAAAIAAPDQPGADKEAENSTKDAASLTIQAAAGHAAEASDAAGRPTADVKQEETARAAAEGAKDGDAMEVDAARAAAKAIEAADGKAQAAIPELPAGNGDTIVTEAKEAQAVLEVAKEEGIQKSDAAAAAAPPSVEAARANTGAPVISDTDNDKRTTSVTAPISEEDMESSAAPADAEVAAGKPQPKAEAADLSKEKTKRSDRDKKEAGGKSEKAQKRDNKDAKEDKAASKSKKKDEKPKENEQERERDRTKEDTKDKSRSRDDRGRSSKEEPPSKRARSERDRDSSSKRREDSSRKSSSRATENGHRTRTRGSERTEADDSKKAEKPTDSKKSDKDGGGTKKGDSKKRPSSGQPQPDAKKPKTENQPEADSKPHLSPKDQSASSSKQTKAEASPAEAATDAPASIADLKPAAAAETAATPAAKSEVANADSAAPAAQQPAAQSVSLVEAPALQLEALPLPEPRWQAQPMPFILACRFFDRDLAGYIEAADLEEILVMVSDKVSRRRLQNLVDTVVKRSKMSYMEQYASLEVPAALPPEHSQQASPELAYPGAAAHTGTSALQSGQLSQLAKDMELSMLHRKLTALAKSEAGLRKTVSTLEGEKSAAEKERTSLDKKRAVLEKEVAVLTEKLSAAQAAASRDTKAAAARGSQAAADISRTLEDLSTVEKGLAAAKEKLIAMSAQAAHTANQLDQQPT